MDNYSVLLVDDDRKLLDLLQEYFQRESFRVYTAMDGRAALDAFHRYAPSILVLDLMLPEIDGREVCRRIRQESSVPILMLTARDDELDRLLGLEIGADDYITKPFSMREVAARVRAILRRSHGEPLGEVKTLHFSDLELERDLHAVRRAGQLIELTPIEFSLLEVFLKNPRRVFNRLQLMENTHGFAFEGYERTMDAHIRNLRRKLERDPKNPQYIQTVYGVGYKLGGT